MNRKNWFDRLVGYLEVKVGPSGMPLVYVIRQGPLGPDQGFGLPSFEAEIKSRGRHAGHFWRGDKKAVWLVLRHLTEGTIAWSTIQLMTNDGRQAFTALLNIYMGIGVKRMLMKRANAYLNNTVYDGVDKRVPWLKHVAKMRECFQDLEASNNPLSPEMQVEKLVQSFQYKPLRYLTSTININPLYSNDFNQAVGLITTELTNLKLLNGTRSNEPTRSVGSARTVEDQDPDPIMKEDTPNDQVAANETEDLVEEEAPEEGTSEDEVVPEQEKKSALKQAPTIEQL